ncbi:endonuclease/exonuclease/phosphatase family protein [Christiangramia flava]|uniref:Uncharacterized protein n=1 Tax=Christiangramia flava JLT2011 TaxID=1229726 RepID=A0A1L7I6Z6_9FLAO|nr:endonuclease/exonuclease/phosphatase family protein [Christiangramia flava]APU69381.1 hypothetical protein GRFL_2657 [Christiangramia flava JLT2011]OSS37704.1 hypothetical protein C723_3337 [Christiangramia flava JLT2011]
MKKLNVFDKFIFILNSLAALALLLSYLLPHIPPESFPLLSVLSLGVPVLIILNIILLLYWSFRLKRQFLLSLVVLLIGYQYVSGFVRFSEGEKDEKGQADFSIMSYNVRMFNAYEWTDRKNIPENITAFVREKDPDIVCMQEFYRKATDLVKIYPYSYIELKGKASEFGSAIFSKYPIIKKYSLNFPQDGNNNAIYADVVIGQDTVRVFNVHFQSLNIKPEINDLKKEDSKKLLGRIGYGFSLQQEQLEMLIPEMKQSPYQKLVVGDFNNTSFSYIYNQLKEEGNFKDAFLEAGSGFGQSFKLTYFPLRIDFMLLEQEMTVQEFSRFEVDYSDHYPVLSKISL